MATKVKRILFVCLGNICRSPAAEGVMQKVIQDAGLEHAIEVDSAGTASYHVGKRADLRMLEAASQRGIDLTSKARMVTSRDISAFDLIVAMDRANYRDLMALTTGPAKQICLLSDFLDDRWPKDVPDPYYGGQEGFDEVLDMLEAACPVILQRITQ